MIINNLRNSCFLAFLEKFCPPALLLKPCPPVLFKNRALLPSGGQLPKYGQDLVAARKKGETDQFESRAHRIILFLEWCASVSCYCDSDW